MSKWEVEACNEEGQEVEEVVPHFWPLEVYNANHEQEAHPDMVDDFRYKNKWIKGVWLEDDGRPLPRGVLKVKNFDRSSVKTNQQVESSDAQFAEDQASVSKDSLRKKFNVDKSPTATTPIAKRPAPTPREKTEKDDSEPSMKKQRKGGKAAADDELEEEDEDGFNFCNFSFPEVAKTSGSAASGKAKAKAKGKAKKSPLAGKVRSMGRASPKNKQETSGGGIPNVPKLPAAKKSGASLAGQPEWRIRHNKQRRMQQVEQHLLNARQTLETFQTMPSKVVVKNVQNSIKALSEALEPDNTFMLYLQGESGALTEEGVNKVHVVCSIHIASDVLSCLVCLYLFVCCLLVLLHLLSFRCRRSGTCTTNRSSSWKSLTACVVRKRSVMSKSFTLRSTTQRLLVWWLRFRFSSSGFSSSLRISWVRPPSNHGPSCS